MRFEHPTACGILVLKTYDNSFYVIMTKAY